MPCLPAFLELLPWKSESRRARLVPDARINIRSIRIRTNAKPTGPLIPSHWRLFLPSARPALIVLLMAPVLALFLAPAIAAAQSDLPDAPEPIVSSAAHANPAVASLADGSRAELAEPALATSANFPDLAAPAEEEPSLRPFPSLDSPTYQSLDFKPARGAQLSLNDLFRSMDRPSVPTSLDGPSQVPEKYHLRLMLWESLTFTGVEDSYRLFTDPYFRHLLANGPYWANYGNALGQWNMRRWWDGDDFLVDEIGHPMEGGVSSFIEIQNSPRQRDLRIGFYKEYWRSRFLGMMWATVFSTQQKIGPLGEAALGDAGAYTYPLHCPYPCKSYKPGVTKYTNNTGWTDFIITPVVGSLWVILEDFLDLEVSDRVMGDRYEAVLPQLLRGALNPCRTMANAMRWRKPWYRDFQHDVPNTYFFGHGSVHFLPGDDEAIRTAPRFELFPHFDAISLPVNTASCFRCRQTLYGYGTGFAMRINKWSDFVSDVSYHSNASPVPSDRAGGSIVMGTFGFRSGWQNSHGALKASIRPGFLGYDRAYETSPAAGQPTPNIGRITHFVAALAINADYVVNRHFALRGVVGNTPVRYRSNLLAPPDRRTPPYLTWLSREQFINNENWTWQAGPVLRF